MTRRGIQWLSAVAEDPELCRARWADDPRKPYALPTGRLFDVVVTSQRIGMEAFDQLQRQNMPVGPAVIDYAAKRTGFFLPTRSHARFTRALAGETDTPPEYRYLEHGSYIVVPGPFPLSGDRYQWLNAPLRRPEASPLRTVALAVMLVAAADTLARADRYGEQYPNVQAAYAKDVQTEAPHVL
ncbi:bifunctional DNA primase/polymerase [Streptomyces sp. MMS24-I2-30]|uniref:bifunctional DNA primase/polymerase n=1 Tax=Streptomyces sp. MMS24-I2-30 TaxID=3351564 RepID=UPI0038968E2F